MWTKSSSKTIQYSSHDPTYYSRKAGVPPPGRRHGDAPASTTVEPASDNDADCPLNVDQLCQCPSSLPRDKLDDLASKAFCIEDLEGRAILLGGTSNNGMQNQTKRVPSRAMQVACFHRRLPIQVYPHTLVDVLRAKLVITEDERILDILGEQFENVRDFCSFGAVEDRDDHLEGEALR
ncbi:hypothetical protein F5141DRAFT_1062950 [Pisolithus sp. B1]|nr:hypothetical protein F5141DRAFT_1062950 [Pisolithus sp. B1]